MPVSSKIIALSSLPLVTAGLGVWQYKRLGWKESMLAEIAAARTAAPLPLPSSTVYTNEELTQLLNSMPYRRIKLSGEYHFDKGMKVGPRMWEGAAGYHWIVPLEATDGSVVLVNRGWIPREAEGTQHIDMRRDTVELLCSLRTADSPNTFTPDNKAELGKWFAILPEQMAEHVSDECLPVVLDVIEETPSHNMKYPIAGQTQGLNIRNNHRQYMYTWFSLSACMLVSLRYVLKAAK